MAYSVKRIFYFTLHMYAGRITPNAGRRLSFDKYHILQPHAESTGEVHARFYRDHFIL
jgi:hypothetical protein